MAPQKVMGVAIGAVRWLVMVGPGMQVFLALGLARLVEQTANQLAY